MDPELIELDERARAEGGKFEKKRFVFPQVERFANERVFLGLVGPRGVGKTVILKQLLHSSKGSFYISLDSVSLPNGLFQVAKELSGKGIRRLLVDEIHILPGFERDLKKIFDFLDLQVVFTSSCSLSLYDSAYDLSRRVRTLNVLPFSFRELIWFEKGVRLPALPLKGFFDAKKSKEYYASCLKYEPLFEGYIAGACYPFAAGKTDVLPLFGNMLETVISKDIFHAFDVSAQEQMEIRRMLKFMGTSPAEDMSYSAIAAGAGITRYNAERYVSILEKAFILRRVFPKGTNVLKEPKIMFGLPYRLLYRQFGECIGALREDFFVESALSAGIGVHYLKTNRGEKTPDYLAENAVFEIGGKGKGRAQFKGVSYKRKIILTHPGTLDELRRPLFFFGML